MSLECVVSRRATKLLALLVVLSVCGRFAALSHLQAEVQQHAAVLSKQISEMAFNITTKYLDLDLRSCGNASLQPLLGVFQEGVARILQEEVRIQLDTMFPTPRIVASVESFNSEQSLVAITLIPTPPYDSPRDISFDGPTLAADGRWSDFAGHTLDDISIYLDPNNPRLQHLMHYRIDVFERHNISSAPQTWQELLEVAQHLNGTDLDGDGLPDYALCYSAQQHCGAPYMLMQGVHPMLFHDSSVKPFFLDPDTLKPYVVNAAMRAALQALTQLSAFNDPSSSASCLPYDLNFCAGHCAITFKSDQFRPSNLSSCDLKGRLGTAVPPGSSVVLDRASNTLVPCTPALCPYAIPSARDSSVLVNFVPISTPMIVTYVPSPSLAVDTSAALGAFAIHQNLHDQTYRQAFADAVLPWQPSASEAPVPGVSDAAIAAAVAVVTNRSTAIANPSVAINPRPLLRLGYDLRDTVGVLQAYAEIAAFNNSFRGIPCPGVSYFRISLGEAVRKAAAPGANIDDVLATLETKYRMVLTAFNNTSLYRKLYWAAIGYQPGTGAATKSSAVNAFLSHQWIAAVLVASAVLGLVVLGLAYARHQHRVGRSLLGKRLPPGVGPATSLLVTGIQGVTGLWEALSPQVMEAVLRVHHGTLQQLLEAHRGYESAAEGGSCILAFHSPSDALAYAVAAQKALLEADWPQELLDHCPTTAACTARPMHTHRDANPSHVVQGLLSLEPAPRSTSPTHWPSVDLGLSSTELFPPPPDDPPLNRLQRIGSKLSLLCVPGLRPTPPAHALPTTRGRGDHRDSGMLGSTGDYAHIAQGAQGRSFRWALSQAWAEDRTHIDPQEPHCSSPSTTSGDAPLIWRGLRVRMGLHSGLSEPNQVVINPTTRRTHYSGSFAAAAKHVCDAGHGGQILLSHTAFEQLSLQHLPSTSCLDIFAMGEHVLAASQMSVPLFQAIVPGLAARLQSFPPLRSKELVVEGVLAATVGVATIVFVNASGVQTLMAWDVEVTRVALHMYHDNVQSTLQKYGGYVAELADGLALVVFPHPAEAIKWALEVQKRLMAAPWPLKLLEHELCEPVVTAVAIEAEDGNVAEVQKMAMRGLRLKVGISTGPVMDYISPATARIMYRGRVMNWAARISHLATGGQVLCSAHSWDAASEPSSRVEGIAAVNAGLHKMKGIQHNVHLYSCTYIHSCAAGVSTTTCHPERRMTTHLMIGTECEQQVGSSAGPVTRPLRSDQAPSLSLSHDVDLDTV